MVWSSLLLQVSLYEISSRKYMLSYSLIFQPRYDTYRLITKNNRSKAVDFLVVNSLKYYKIYIFQVKLDLVIFVVFF